MSTPTRAHSNELDSIGSYLRLSVIDAMDRAAEAGAVLALAGKRFSLFSVVSCIENKGFSLDELTMIAWAAELGYREGFFRALFALRPKAIAAGRV